MSFNFNKKKRRLSNLVSDCIISGKKKSRCHFDTRISRIVFGYGQIEHRQITCIQCEFAINTVE
jgi:hypothetical protein